jgi:hypothetical protein
MKRLITLCAIFIISACTVAMAQTTTDKTKEASTKEIKPSVKADVPSSTDQPAAVQQAGTKKVLTTDLKPNVQGNTSTTKRLGEHGPYLNDPDYDAKKAEWMKNYPQEYDALIKANTETEKK